MQKVLKTIVCSECRNKLNYDEKAQTLNCVEHGAFQVVDGIPSFVENHEFDTHWDANRCEDIPQQKKQAALNFLAPLIKYLNSQKGLSVLDAGCGDGVHVEVLSDLNNVKNGHSFTGVDISFSALHAIRKRKHSDWKFVHADIGKLPYEDNSFDAVFSFGVLAYTDDPYHSFSELCRVVRKGGMVGVWLYPKTRGIKGALFSFVRKTCQLAGPLGRRLIADSIVLFLGLLPTSSGLSLRNATWGQCREIVLVNIAPSKLYFPDTAEVEGWFDKNNISISCRDEKLPITLWGIKS